MLRRLLPGLLAASCLATGATACGKADDAPRRLSPFFGINTHDLLDAEAGDRKRRLDALSKAGLGTARTVLYWDFVEPAPPVGGRHTYDWRRPDGVIADLAARGMRIQPILGFTTPWAQSVPGEKLAPPRDIADFAAYAAAVVERYGPRGAFWKAHPNLPPRPITVVEVWNEPDNPVFWRPAPDPAAYARMFLAARSSMKAVDASILVEVGGLSVDATSYLRDLYAQPGMRGAIDRLGFHPYELTPAGVLDRIARIRQELRRLGTPGVPIDVSEIGWPTSGSTGYVVSEQARAQYLQTLVELLVRSDCGVSAVFPYTWRTPETDRADEQHWYGLAGRDGRLNVGGRAYAEAVGRQEPRRRARTAPELRVCG